MRASKTTSKSFGIEILDVRIKRVDFVANITDSIYSRMRSERQRMAGQLRSTRRRRGRSAPTPTASGRSSWPRPTARHQVKGEDARRRYLCRGFRARPAVRASSYRSLEAYRSAFRTKGDVMVLDPASDFFKGHARRGTAAAPAAAPAPSK